MKTDIDVCVCILLWINLAFFLSSLQELARLLQEQEHKVCTDWET